MNDLPTLDALRNQLQHLRQAGAEGFDVFSVRVIAALLARADTAPPSLQQDMRQRIHQRLQALQQDFTQARDHARQQARALREQHPERNEALVRLFRAGEFRAIARQAAATPAPASPLAELLQRLVSHDPALSASADPQTFDEVLRKQELEAQQGNGLSSLHSHLNTRLDSEELRSARLFREHWAQRVIERAIARALDEAPENAGPLNAHQLVIRAVTTMQTLAPAYLNRFVSYVDTLVWLEQAARHFGVPNARAGRPRPGGERQ